MRRRAGLTLLGAAVIAQVPGYAQAAPGPDTSDAWEQESGEADDPAVSSALDIARDIGISDDDVRPADQLQTSLLGKPLIIGGEIGTEIRARTDYELNGDNEDEVTASPEATLEAIWLPTDDTVVFASADIDGAVELTGQDGRSSSRADIELRNLWVLRNNFLVDGFALQVGRQRIQDRREWWWDESLDALRLHFFGEDLTGFAALGIANAIDISTRDRIGPEERGIVQVLANVDWRWSKQQHIGLYFLHQDDRTRRHALGETIARGRFDEHDARLTWIGLRTRGCIKARLPRRICYWGEIASVSGHEFDFDITDGPSGTRIVDAIERRKIHGWAYDVGASIELPLPQRPYLTLGHARGSGDKPGTPGRDGAFRQSGLHQNNGKFRGNSKFRYYGEVLRPDLSNIAIGTVALGIPVVKRGWVETIWHRYRQPAADKTIPGSPLDNSPNGKSGRLGQEFDVIASYRPRSRWEFELTAGAFQAGPAFGKDNGRWAHLFSFEVGYNF